MFFLTHKLTDTVPGAGAEGDVGVAVSPDGVLGQEAFRVEHLRVGELLRVVVEAENVDHDARAGGDAVVAWWRRQCYLFLNLSIYLFFNVYHFRGN